MTDMHAFRMTNIGQTGVDIEARGFYYTQLSHSYTLTL